MAVILAALLAFAAAAQGAGPSCSAANAEPATIAGIMEDPAGHEGRCVEVTALSNGWLLFGSVDAYYLAGPLIGGNPPENPAYRSLGLINRRQTRRIPRGGLHHVAAVGSVQRCQQLHVEAEAAAARGELIWVGGYCHMSGGPYLWLHDVRILRGRARPVRLTGDANRARLGGLVPASDDWPHRAFVEAQADRWLAALQSGDRAGFMRLHPPGEPEAEEAARLAFSRHRGFADIRRAQAPQRAIFVSRTGRGTRPGGAVLHGPAGDGEYASTICFCRSDDCSDRWPIIAFDADNREDRPYVCTRFVPFMVLRQGWMPAFITKRDWFGLAELGSTRG